LPFAIDVVIDSVVRNGPLQCGVGVFLFKRFLEPRPGRILAVDHRLVGRDSELSREVRIVRFGIAVGGGIAALSVASQAAGDAGDRTPTDCADECSPFHYPVVAPGGLKTHD